MKDGVRLAVTLYMPAKLSRASAFPRCSSTCLIARTTMKLPVTTAHTYFAKLVLSARA
jgi:predicted acyl esterase